MSAYKELEFTRVSDYIPKWHDEEKVQEKHRRYEQMEYETDTAENAGYEDKIDYEVYKNTTPNFGSNTKIGEQDSEENNIKIPLDETIFDPDSYIETDADDILNE